MEIFSRLFSRQNRKLSLFNNNKDSANIERREILQSWLCENTHFTVLTDRCLKLQKQILPIKVLTLEKFTFFLLLTKWYGCYGYITA